jgi:multidrug efflux system membrane fusion protein
MRHLHRLTGLAAAWIGLVLALAACRQENAYVPPPPPEVTVANPVAEKVTLTMELTGTTTAVNQVDLMARVPGYLDAIDYKDGTTVKKGDLLFLIEQPPYQAQLYSAKAQQAALEAQLVQAQAEFTRQQDLVRSQTAAQAKLDEARAKRDSTQAQIDGAKANVAMAQITLGYTEVRAPFDGAVSARLESVGALVGQGAPTKLATIVQVDPIWVTFNVAEDQVQRIRDNLRAQGKTLAELGPVEIDVGLQTEQGFPHQGLLDYVAPEVDSTTGTLPARAVFANKDRALLPGSFVRVRVPTARDVPAILVPDEALGTGQEGRYALVVGTDDLVEQRPVTVGQLVDGRRIVTKGLTPQDRIVVGGIQRAVPGAKVVPKPAPAG